MSGSLVWRTYTTDAGTAINIQRDESNCEALAGTSPMLTAFTSGAGGLSTLIRPRYINTVLSTDPNRKKKFVVGVLATFNSLNGGSTIVEPGANGGTWNVTSKVGEFSRLPSASDTGLTDGDAT